MDFFHLVAVGNQKMGLNKLEVEIATGIMQFFFPFKDSWAGGNHLEGSPFFVSGDAWFPAVTSAERSSLDIQPFQTLRAVVLHHHV